jgi:D-methionine transport system ATP-binding protein
MIELQQIHKTYSTPAGKCIALSDIDLKVNTGEIFGIIGKSGAGKSTLIRTVNLLEKPDSGKVFIADQELTLLSANALREARRKIGMIFQHFNLLSSRTVYDNVALPLELSGQTKNQIAKIITPLLELTGLINKKNTYPSQLSGGQKQRVAIARALASKPNVLLSDEATSSLDPETTQSILQLLQNIRNTLSLTILLITHEMSVIKSCCDRVAILDHGKIIETNEVGEFFSHPKTDIAKNFVAASLPKNLPETIEQYLLPQAQNNTHPVIRLWFTGDVATQPVVSQLINQFDLRINILQAHVECIKKHTMGIMIVAIDGSKEKWEAAINYLIQLGIHTEVIGHVPIDIITFN